MGKVALITGAGRGIGAATAVLAARSGYDVCINYASDAVSAEKTAAECSALGARSIAVRADIGKRDQVLNLFETCDGELGPIGLLVNNAAIVGGATRVEDLDPQVLARVFEINVYGAIWCSQEAVRRMSTQNGGKGGSIVNISSIAATLGSPGEYVHYAASKGAIDTFTIGLAREVGPVGIRVNAVQAGTTETDIHVRSGNPDRPRMVAQNAPLRRVAQPQDIAESVLWLASDKASYTTGAILRVSGGL